MPVSGNAARKNKPTGSRLVRGCWCSQSKVGALLHMCVGSKGCTYWEQVTCPFHVVGRVLDGTPVGSRVFPDVTPANALGVLRVVLSKLEVPLACEYRTHDLRRGHTQDLVESGLGEPFA